MVNSQNSPCFRLLATLATFPDTPLKCAIENFCAIKQQISQLSQEIKNAAEEDKRKIKRRLRYLEKVEYEDAKTKLYSRILQSRRFLSKPRDLIKYGTEYESLRGEIIALACSKICEEFEPRDNKPLDKSLVNWINHTLRLYYRVIELTSPGKRTKKERLLDTLIGLINLNEGEVSLEDFAEAANLDLKEAKKFLDEQVEAFEGSVNNTLYSFIPERVRHSPETERKRQMLHPYELDAPIGEDGATLGDVVLNDNTDLWKQVEQIKPNQTIGKKIQDYLNNDPENRLGNCLNNRSYSCKTLIQRLYIAAQSGSNVAEEYQVNRQTLQADLERHCLPLLYTIIIELTDTERLKKYIENDSLEKLRNCYFEVPKCNCQALAMRLLTCFKSPPDKVNTQLAREYGIESKKVAKMKRFWNVEGLHLLSKIAVELEQLEE